MAHRTVHRLACLVTLLAVTSAKKDQTRWSRQISTYTADISDWVPLSGPVEREPLLPPIKRQAIAEPRILTEPFPGLSRPTGFGQETFPSRTYYNSPVNRQLYLQSMPAVPSAPQNYLTDQGFGQSIRFGLSQPNFPLNQGFVAPQYSFENMPQIKQQVTRPQQVPQQVSQQGQHPQQVQGNPIKFESFHKPSIPASSQAKPFNNQVPKIRPEAPKFIDGYRAENASNDFAFNSKKKPQSLQKIKFENSDKPPKIETISQNNQKLEREEVQLLYVPLEQLNRGQFNFRSPITSSQTSNTDIFAQGIQRPSPLKQTLESEFQPKQIENYSRQEYFGNYNSPKEIDQTGKFTTVATPFPTQPPTSPKPKKLKPHQPPLAIFLTQEASRRNQVKVGDVLTSLKSANTIAVLDSVNPLNAPSVFIGPSHLTPPENYVRFELPYLSNIENTDKKLRQLPFFVAPLSYNTPQGFAKIPFPSPHVGSVVINSQIKETTAAPIKPGPTANIPNSYSPPLSYKQEQKPITQRPQVSFYSTNSPRTNSPTNNNYQSNYYSIEPQTVSTIRPPKEPEASISKNPPKAGYFLTNVENNSNQYNTPQYSNYPQESYKPEPVQSYKEPVQRYKEPAISYNIPKQAASTTTVRTTVSTTTKSPSTYPSQLLETHNPYSINQAFHFSTPLDYHNYFEENYATPPAAPEFNPSVSSPSPPISTAPPKPEEVVTEKNKYQQQSSPNYLQNYSPEIHYESEVQNSRYPIYSSNDYTPKTELSSENTQPASPVYTDSSPPISSFNPTAYSENHESQPTVSQQSITDEINKLPGAPDLETPPTQYESNQYETNYETEEYISTTPSTTTTSTSTRRPLRSRGRPRYTTTSRTDSNESSTRFAVTRRPLRERRPLPTRSRYEPNRITTEKPARKPIDSNESTTKSNKGRTRGRIHYKPSGNDETFERVKSHNSNEADLAYQRDVLHQNYPVTLMERTSTVDIEAITEPTPKVVPATNYLEPATETYDAENAYTNERATITQHIPDTESKDDIHVPNFTSRTPQTESSYSRGQPTRNNEYSFYQSRSSLAPVDAISSYDETGADVEDNYQKPTTPVQNIEKEPEVLSYATEPVSSFTEQSAPIYSRNNEFSTIKQEEVTTVAEIEETNAANHEENEETEAEENTVQTTPSYNRVRIRPGVIRQYHQSPSTESSKINQNRRPAQSVTYRPAFDRRRTTMRIDEIEADLKTKQVHSRPDVQDYRHPIYKPEPTTEPSVTLPITQGMTKRGHFRRRRPSNSYTTSTEASVARKNNYEVKNRFRGRRPTEKPTDKPEVQTESTSTVRNTPYSRYSHRPRLSERYNKKPEPEETEDQDSNFSISRPEYAEPETEQWSSKISTDSFKPYNPNDIVDEQKVETTERKSDKDELDIITARNDEYDDILISVTPATNSRNTKKIPDIPPTLEALVEQSKVTKSDSNDKMSTFESMLEEVMKSLEEQDEDEYTSNVMKHKGGEIGEIPPERIISSGDINTTTPIQHGTTTEPIAEDPGLINEDESDRKGRRRGFWKKVNVRPVNADSIEVAESQYYSHTVNRLGQTVKQSKSVHDKTEKYEKPKIAVTTYKPRFQFIKNIFTSDNEPLPIIDVLPTVDIPKLNKPKQDKETLIEAETRLTSLIEKEAQAEKTEVSPGDFDLGTGSPDPSIDDAYYTTPTEPTTPSKTDITDRSDTFSFMDYLFGVTSDDSNTHIDSKNNENKTDVEITTEQLKNKIVTTDSTYIPEEITATVNSDISEAVTESIDVKKTNATESKETEKVTDTTEISVVKVETSSVSSFMNPTNVVSTSKSTEISHETEICFRGKCIKTSKDIL